MIGERQNGCRMVQGGSGGAGRAESGIWGLGGAGCKNCEKAKRKGRLARIRRDPGAKRRRGRPELCSPPSAQAETSRKRTNERARRIERRRAGFPVSKYTGTVADSSKRVAFGRVGSVPAVQGEEMGGGEWGSAGADAVRDAESGMDRRSAAQSLHHRPFWTLAVSGNLGAACSAAACSSQHVCSGATGWLHQPLKFTLCKTV
jgi:hypothetical protein